MKGCLSSTSFLILASGSDKGLVKGSRSLRQGYPLSPFLFTLVVDVLSILMFRVVENGLTKGVLVEEIGLGCLFHSL